MGWDIRYLSIPIAAAIGAAIYLHEGILLEGDETLISSVLPQGKETPVGVIQENRRPFGGGGLGSNYLTNYVTVSDKDGKQTKCGYMQRFHADSLEVFQIGDSILPDESFAITNYGVGFRIMLPVNENGYPHAITMELIDGLNAKLKQQFEVCAKLMQQIVVKFPDRGITIVGDRLRVPRQLKPAS